MTNKEAYSYLYETHPVQPKLSTWDEYDLRKYIDHLSYGPKLYVVRVADEADK
jgi:hypothetical protein